MVAQLTDHEEVSGQAVLGEVVVGEIQHLQHGEGAEATRQGAQLVHSGDTAQCERRTNRTDEYPETSP